MTEPAAVAPPAREDDWEQHWDAYGDAADGNPANRYRHRRILEALGAVGSQTLVDIGSGQGELAVQLAQTFPSARVIGIEYSASGVTRSRERAEAAGVTARFRQADLLRPVADAGDLAAVGTLAVCSEVLEHVDEPAVLLSNARVFLAPGCRLVVTVPAGPRSAFDRHIGHKRHFTPATLGDALTAAGFEVEKIDRGGFPFFNLYRLAVVARGKKLIADLESPAHDAGAGSSALLRAFDHLFRWNRPDFPLGWQLIAIARLPESSR